MNLEDSANDPAMSLSVAQMFEVEKYTRMINSCTSVEDLRKLSKMLLQAWMTQKAATDWVIRNSLGTRDK